MNIVFLTQDEPFYLAENLNYLITQMPIHSKIAACVLFAVSPFGKKETMFNKARRTYNVFGLLFFIRYTFYYIWNKIDSKKSVRKVLEKHEIPILRLKGSVNSSESLELINSYKPDLLISIAGNEVFKRPVIELAPKKCLNLHTALLPKYRGLMPTFWVMKNNEKYTGVSVFFVDEGIDSGPILVQKKIEIGDRTLEDLIRHTKKVGMDAVLEAIELIHENNYQLIENNESKMSYYSFPKKKDVKEFITAGKRFY